MTVLPRRRGIVRGLRALGPHVLPRGATGSVVARPWPGCPRPSGATQAMAATHGRPGPYRAPQRQCRPSGGVPGGPGGPVPGVGYRPPGGSREAPEGPRGASWAGFSGPEKGQKMAFFWTLRRKVQGEWGGSAHSPDPTAHAGKQGVSQCPRRALQTLVGPPPVAVPLGPYERCAYADLRSATRRSLTLTSPERAFVIRHLSVADTPLMRA